MRGIFEYAPLFITGGLLYNCIEMAARGHSHWSMFLAGGLCLLLLCLLYQRRAEWPLWKKGLAGAGIITAVEFAFGCVFNLWLGMGVWDYSQHKFHILGQVCPLFFLYWFFLAGAVALLMKPIRRFLLTP